MENIEIIVNSIIKKINPNWTKMQIMRYTYLELGQILEKNTDFFLNDKLGNYGLSQEEMEQIYNNDRLPSRETSTGDYQYQVICKSAALILKTIFDKFNIESELVQTTANESTNSNIRHCFLIAQDDEKKQYFLTLAADLPFIKNELPTEHFGTNLNFFSADGVAIYVVPHDTKMKTREIVDKNTHQKGIEFDHTFLSEKSLKEIDESIGYERLYQTKDLLSFINLKTLYYENMEVNSDIYAIFRKALNIHDDGFKSGYSITEKEIDNFINDLKNYVYSKLGSEKEIISTLIKEMEDPVYSDHDDLELFMLNNKKALKKMKNSKLSEFILLLKQVFELEHRFLALKEAKREITSFYMLHKDKEDYNVTEYYRLAQNYKKAIANVSIIKISSILNHIAFYFLKDQITINNPIDYVSTNYILTKFTVMFPLVFDCNYKNNRTVKVNSFSIQNYSEQIVVLKKVLSIIFSGLTEKNCADIEDYDWKFTPLENRIQMFPLRDKISGEYSVGFRFGKKSEENAPEFIYIPSENLLKIRDPIEDKDKYWICSRRFNDTLKNAEDMEEKLLSGIGIKK